MTTPDLDALSALTRDYAAFQTRKSGLATALGGAMALLVGLNLFHPIRVLAGRWWHIQAALVFFMPVIWLPLKQILFHRLYRGLGPVKALDDLDYENKKWQWIFMVALVLMTFQTLALMGFVSGYAGVLSQPETIRLLPARLPGVWQSWLWVAGLPWLYLVLAPWWIKGVEEARAYLVLAGQSSILMLFSFIHEGANINKATKVWIIPVFMLIQLGVFVWGIRTIMHGWREHREYLTLLRSLPRES